MGASLSSFSRHSSSRQQPKAVSSNGGNTAASSIIECIMPGCLKTKKTTRKKKQSDDQPLSDKKMNTKAENNNNNKLTLQEWLMASPGRPSDCFSGGGELYAFKNSSRRVHPSSSTRGVSTSKLATKAIDSFSLKRSVVQTTDERAEEVSSISCGRSQSGKLKKKVSFRLPEESDIILFYSPEETRSDEDYS